MDTPQNYELSQVPLDDLLLALEVTRSSVDLSLESNAGRACLSVHQGRLDDASFGDQSGLEAVLSMLSLRDGRYQLSAKSSEPKGLNKSLGRIVEQKLRSGGPFHLPRSAAHPPATVPLERTGKALPSGLEPIELRTLAAINGSFSALDIAVQEQGFPADTLNAVRRLVQLGLVKPTMRGTLALGTRIPLAGSPDTLKSSGPGQPSRRVILSDEPVAAASLSSSGAGADPEDRQREAKKSSKPVPARLRSPGSRKPENTGYSSVPPPSFAEEHVKIPATPRPIHMSTLPSATGRTVAVYSPGPPRPKLDSDEIGPDPLLIATAQGQLRDSELPVPSTHLGKAALEQLEELNEAVSSSRAPRLPKLRYEEESQDYRVPGSVPDPAVLPGEAAPGESNLPVVGRYEILSRLKRGGMGSVYLCRLSGSAGFRRHFAMKVLHGHLAEKPEALDAFFHEARVLGGLHHRNIVGIADVGTPSEPYFVLEYVEGGSLAELYRATRDRRDPGVIVSIVLDALNGLTAAHAATDLDGRPLQLVHCDVTPHNLLVGIDGTCRVTDFGIARTSAADAVGEITRGKPGYIAPERLSRKPSDHRSDLFSLGVVLYAGLTGCEPFAGESADETMRNVLGKVIVPPSETGFRPPPSLDWVCMKALARDPQERFQTAEEMASQLRRVATREGLLAAPTDVAAWVSESIAPTLAVRRAASLRGTLPPEGRSSIPPAVRGSNVAPADAPSAMEHTGPLEAPASSRDFSDKTDVFSLESKEKATSPGAGARARTMAIYAALALAVAALVWVALSPGSIRGYLLIAPPAGQASGVDQGVRPADMKTPSQSDTSREPKVRDDNQDGIVIPAIVPSEREK